MEKRTTKKEIVKMLLDLEIGEQDEQELLDLLVDQPLAIDIDKQEAAKMRIGDRIADKISEIAGSWAFILLFVLFLGGWIVLNVFILKEEKQLDPYPFILLNLLLSCIAALQAPIIMMSQNRQAAKDSLRNHNDYRIDLKSELILEELHDKMELIISNQKDILNRVKTLEAKRENEK